MFFLKGTGKKNTFKQVDYLTQILALHIQGILEIFAAVIYAL